MPEDKETHDDLSDSGTPTVNIPSRAPIPPPPVVEYQRPTPESQVKSGSRFDPVGGKYTPVDKEREDREFIAEGVRGYGIAITGVISLIATVIGFLVIGQWIDKRFEPNGTPWGTIVGALLGMLGGFLNMFRIMLGPGGTKKRKRDK